MKAGLTHKRDPANPPTQQTLVSYTETRLGAQSHSFHHHLLRPALPVTREQNEPSQAPECVAHTGQLSSDRTDDLCPGCQHGAPTLNSKTQACEDEEPALEAIGGVGGSPA